MNDDRTTTNGENIILGLSPIVTMRIVWLLSCALICTSVRQLGVVTAFSISSNVVRQPWSEKHANAPVIAQHVSSTGSTPLFAVKNSKHGLLSRRQKALSLFLRKWVLRLVTATLSLAIFWRGLSPLPALAAKSAPPPPAKQTHNRVVPVVGAIAVASGAGVVVGKKLDARKSDEAKEEEDSTSETVATEVPEGEPEEEEPKPEIDAKEAERLRAQELVKKTLKEIEAADRKALLKRSEPEPTNRGRTAMSKLKSSTPAPTPQKDTVAQDKPKEPSAPAPKAPEVTQTKAEAVGKTSLLFLLLAAKSSLDLISELLSVPLQKKTVETPKKEPTLSVPPPEKAVETPKKEPKLSVPPPMQTPKKEPTLSVPPPVKPAATPKKEPTLSVPPPKQPVDAPKKEQPKPPPPSPKNGVKQSMFMNREKSLQAKYAAMESDEERAFNILLDLGMIERTPDPDDSDLAS